MAPLESIPCCTVYCAGAAVRQVSWMLGLPVLGGGRPAAHSCRYPHSIFVPHPPSAFFFLDVSLPSGRSGGFALVPLLRPHSGCSWPLGLPPLRPKGQRIFFRGELGAQMGGSCSLAPGSGPAPPSLRFLGNPYCRRCCLQALLADPSSSPLLCLLPSSPSLQVDF